jgi:hypothetical protein
VLAAAAAYEAAIALGWISMGSLPGDDAPGSGIVLAAALLALVVGAVALAAGASGRAAAAVLVAGAAFLVADFFTYDSYYLPALQRYSENPSYPGWVAGLALTMLAAAAAARWVARPGAVLLLVCAATAFSFGIGH